MPFDLPLSPVLRKAGWKVKIHDFERLEPPHVTIYRKRQRWRLGLRDGEFLDAGAKWSQIDDEVHEAITDNWQALCDAWDEIHEENPVEPEDDDDDHP